MDEGALRIPMAEEPACVEKVGELFRKCFAGDVPRLCGANAEPAADTVEPFASPTEAAGAAAADAAEEEIGATLALAGAIVLPFRVTAVEGRSLAGCTSGMGHSAPAHSPAHNLVSA